MLHGPPPLDTARMNALGALLRKRRDELKRRGLTVRSIAAKAGLPESTVYLHLSKRTPYEQTPFPRVLDSLAVGFDLDPDEVWQAARESTGRETVDNNPLQLLVQDRMGHLHLSPAEVTRLAKDAGHSMSRATVSNLLTGKYTQIAPETVAALAAVLKVPKRQIEEASAQAQRRVSYRLPRRLEERMTPEKWDRIVQIVEGIVTLDEEP